MTVEAPEQVGSQPVERSVRERILGFESEMAAFPGATFGNQEHCLLKHSFAGGIYVREIFIPKGYLITGKIHRHEHPIFLMSGEVSIVDETSGSRKIKGPCNFISPPGTKRLLFTHEDTVFVTVHEVGEERDIARIEQALTADSYDEYEKGLKCSEIHSLSEDCSAS